MAPGILLLNPPSPRGRVANREAAGGVGSLVARNDAWVYPAHRLAEAAGWLQSRGRAYQVRDRALATGLRDLRWPTRAPEEVIVQTALATLEHDLGWVESRPWSPSVVVTGTGLSTRRELIEATLPGARIDDHPTGFAAGALAAGEDPQSVGGPDDWPDAAWSRPALGRKRRLSIYHGRGCTCSCSYCPYVIATGRNHLVRSPERTLEEFAAQVRRHRPRRVIFRDPVFALDRGGTLRLLAGLADLPSDARCPFEVESRPECLDDEVLGALARAGCVEVKLGVESMETAPLIATRRVADAEAAHRYREAVAGIMKTGASLDLLLRIYLMQGLPGSTAAGDESTEAGLSDQHPRHVKALETPPIEVPA